MNVPNWITSEKGWHHIDRIRGIPVTFKRLARCGFIERVPGTWQLKGFSGFEIRPISAGGDMFQAIHQVGSTGHYVVKVNVRYIHELQNLFHAIDDRELNIVK